MEINNNYNQYENTQKYFKCYRCKAFWARKKLVQCNCGTEYCRICAFCELGRDIKTFVLFCSKCRVPAIN